MASLQALEKMGPPWPPQTASVGGIPSVDVDVPICAVFLALYLAGAVGHMTILQLNRRRGHKFIMSGLLFGFCMARIVTCTMRIVWATRPHNVRVGIAAMIFVSAGVLLLFVINLIFTQRIVRAAHPHFGWHKALSTAFKILYTLVVLMLAAVITVTVQSFYTLNKNTHRIDRDIQLTTATYFMSIAFAPIPMIILGLVVPRKTRLEKFGSGRWRTKIRILLTSAALLTLGAAFRTGTSFKNPRPSDDPAWYHAKWCFYIFNFTVEVIVVHLYILLRVDRRFYVPNGSKGPGDYSRGETDAARRQEADARESFASATRIMSEEEVFDDQDMEKCVDPRPVSKEEETAPFYHAVTHDGRGPA